MSTTRFAAICFIISLCLHTHAQIGKYRNDLAIGVNAGIALNKVSFDPIVNQEFHMGPEIGATVRYTCEKYFAAVCAFQVEINYTSSGWIEASPDGSQKLQRDMGYMQFPILARIGFGREKQGFMGFVTLGPQLGYCISDKTSGEYPNAKTNLEVANKFNYGISIGGGLEFSHRKLGHFVLEGRYYFGLSDTFSNSKSDPFSKSANGTISCKLSYLFDVIKTKGVEVR